MGVAGISLMQVLSSQLQTPLRVLRKKLQVTYTGLEHHLHTNFESPVTCQWANPADIGEGQNCYFLVKGLSTVT